MLINLSFLRFIKVLHWNSYTHPLILELIYQLMSFQFNLKFAEFIKTDIR